MGSITKMKRVAKATGKTVTVYRAYVRRKGFASKSKVCPTERAAKEFLRNNEADVTLRRPSSGKSLGSLIDDFIKAPPAKGSRSWTAGQLDFWRAELGTMPVCEISRRDINAAKMALQVRAAVRQTPAGLRPTGATIAPGTVNRYLASLSSLLNWAVDNEIIDVHPMKAGRVSKLKESAGRTRVITDEEEARLIDAARKGSWPPLALLLRMLLTTAARRNEVLQLKWKDLRLDESIAIVNKTKNGRPRALPLVTDVVAALREAAKVRPLTGDYIFFNPKDPKKSKNIDIPWRACREAAGLLNDREDKLDRIVLHSSRHTAITRMLKGGANLAQAAAVSGHQTLAMLKRYEHLAAQDSVELAERLLSGNK